jgi:hypothetical protein
VVSDFDAAGGFTFPPVPALGLAFGIPVNLPVGILDSGLTLVVAFICSCLFFSKAFLFSAIASVLSFSLARFSSSFFFRSASISLGPLGTAFGLPRALGFLATPVVAVLLGLVAGLPVEAGFFVSEQKVMKADLLDIVKLRPLTCFLPFL